jgi:hypothetical protein
MELLFPPFPSLNKRARGWLRSELGKPLPLPAPMPPPDDFTAPSKRADDPS